MKTTFSVIPVKKLNYTIVHIPEEISRVFQTRGLLLASVTLFDHSKVLPLEPDGYGSHWFDCTELIFEQERENTERPMVFEIDTEVDWYPPELPEDFRLALEINDLTAKWDSVTVKAKWEWIRWIRSTANADTRAGRIDAACDKLAKGMKRPCCYDQTRCSIPEVSKTGKLVII